MAEPKQGYTAGWRGPHQGPLCVTARGQSKRNPPWVHGRKEDEERDEGMKGGRGG